MNHHIEASICHESASPRKMTAAGMERLPGALGRTRLLLCVLAAMVAGCESKNIVEIQNPDHFRQEVLASDQPVLVDFYKGDCPICMALDPVIDRLSTDYQGRAKIAKFMIMTGYWTIPYWDFKQEYRLWAVPTVVLFNKGVEVKRWENMYMISRYREELDKLVVPVSGQAPASEP